MWVKEVVLQRSWGDMVWEQDMKEGEDCKLCNGT